MMLKLSSRQVIVLPMTSDLAIDLAQRFLRNLQRHDLATLLSPCSISISNQLVGPVPDFPFLDDDGISGDARRRTVAIVYAPTPINLALVNLPKVDGDRIIEAIKHGHKFFDTCDHLKVETLPSEVHGATELLAELIIHREMMIDIATGQQRIQEVNDYYVARQARICELLPADVLYENKHDDLWAWYHHWKEHFGSYAERRTYVRELFAPAIKAISRRSSISTAEREPSGWGRVDRALGKARAQLELASEEEDFQTVGLLCREVIISLAQAVFDHSIHETMDGVEASKTDANRMLDAYVANVFPGESNKEIRAHHRASLALALKLQHHRTATQQLAALCVEATASTVAVVSIIARGAESRG